MAKVGAPTPPDEASLQGLLTRAVGLLQLQEEFIESQQRQIKKLRIDLTAAREVRAIVLQTLDDVGALRRLMASI